MAILANSQHEKFAQLIAAGKKRGQAYRDAIGDVKGADQSASRLLKSAKVSARVAELQAEIGSKLLDKGIRSLNYRVEVLQDGLDQLLRRRRWLTESIDQLRLERGEKLSDETAGGHTGLLVHDFKGLSGNLRDVYRVDSGLASLLGELRAIDEEIREHMVQAAKELGQWMDKSELTVKDGDLAARLAKGRERVAKLKAVA